MQRHGKQAHEDPGIALVLLWLRCQALGPRWSKRVSYSVWWQWRSLTGRKNRRPGLTRLTRE